MKLYPLNKIAQEKYISSVPTQADNLGYFLGLEDYANLYSLCGSVCVCVCVCVCVYMNASTSI